MEGKEGKNTATNLEVQSILKLFTSCLSVSQEFFRWPHLIICTGANICTRIVRALHKRQIAPGSRFRNHTTHTRLSTVHPASSRGSEAPSWFVLVSLSVVGLLFSVSKPILYLISSLRTQFWIIRDWNFNHHGSRAEGAGRFRHTHTRGN